MKEYFYRDNVFTFEGSVSVEENQNYAAPWRIDFSRIRMFPVLNEENGKLCSGVRLCFSSDSKKITLKFDVHDYDIQLDIFINNLLYEKTVLKKGLECIEINTETGGIKDFAVWLDHGHQVRLKSVSVSENAVIKKTPVTQKRWVHYGSSISLALAADSPSNIWASIAARKNSLHLTNLGFGGQCKIEPMAAFLIRDLPSDLITLKLGINVHMGDLTQRTFLPAILGFISIIREKKPDTPVVLISPIYSPPREDVRSAELHVSLREMRIFIQEAAEILKFYGDSNVHYADGLKIFGPDELKYLPDEVHPNADGQPVLALNFENEVFGAIGF